MIRLLMLAMVVAPFIPLQQEGAQLSGPPKAPQGSLDGEHLPNDE